MTSTFKSDIKTFLVKQKNGKKVKQEYYKDGITFFHKKIFFNEKVKNRKKKHLSTGVVYKFWWPCNKYKIILKNVFTFSWHIQFSTLKTIWHVNTLWWIQQNKKKTKNGHWGRTFLLPWKINLNSRINFLKSGAKWYFDF